MTPEPVPSDPVARSRRRTLLLSSLLAALLLVDVARAPEKQISARVLMGSIHAYQATLSRLMPGLGVRCRFTPTCSHYAEGAVRQYGALGGSVRAVWRVMRCGPWTPLGTQDPP